MLSICCRRLRSAANAGRVVLRAEGRGSTRYRPRGRRDDTLPADGSSTRGGSTSVRGRVRSPHASGGRSAAGSQRGYSLGWGRQTDGSRYRLMPTYAGGIIIVYTQFDHNDYNALMTTDRRRRRGIYRLSYGIVTCTCILTYHITYTGWCTVLEHWQNDKLGTGSHAQVVQS